MAALIFLSNLNLGDYLSRSWSYFIKSIIRTGQNNAPNSKNQVTCGCWHNLPGDIIETVVNQLTLTDRIRMSSVCKGWRVILTKKDIQTVVEIPWLMLLQYPIGKDISFYNFSEERVYNLELPKSVHGGWCYGCSKGWLIMITGSEFNPSLFLLNPITGAQLQLPSLTTIPSFESFAIWHSKFEKFITRITISSTDAAECIVAAICDDEILVFCRPTDERWNIFQGEGEDNGNSCDALLFRNNTLYVLIDSEENCVRNFSIKLSDCQMMLTLISFHYNGYFNVEDEVVEFQHFKIFKETCIHYDLAESTDSELLVIVQILDIFALKDDILDDVDDLAYGDDLGEGEEHDIGEGNQEHEDGDDIGERYEDENGCPLRLRYWKTIGFEAFRINLSNGHCDILNSLGHDTVLFLDIVGSSCFLNRDSNGIHGNSIYFTSNISGREEQATVVSRESGVFYLGGGRIERFLPSLKPAEVRGWFTANI
ncbi:unnamed protein product [Ilex paraguariensis]|uniref:F-box domain-containing protein n=1 Tax=Ilex paraguariensis TaxID=185542 RepID=A0ABC8R1C0_9AQUA